MTMRSRPPNFWEVFAEALQASARNRSWLAFLPWCLFLCGIGPLITVWIVSCFVPLHIGDDGAITILSSVAVVAGFFGSVSIATLGQAQRMVSEYPFSSYLRDQGLFDQYLFWPQFTLIFQITLLLVSVLAAVTVRLIESDDINRFVIALDIGLLIYVCTKTWNLNRSHTQTDVAL
jgi:hypothetical protein